jgi:hypothetical protein
MGNDGNRRPRVVVAQLPLGVKLTGRVAWVGWLGLHIVGDPP